eukprot:scaffold98645_cov31-Phaeocystis_antarctica.AAC.2
MQLEDALRHVPFGTLRSTELAAELAAEALERTRAPAAFRVHPAEQRAAVATRGQAACPHDVLQPAEGCRRSSGCHLVGRGRP